MAVSYTHLRQYNSLHKLLESTANFILRDALPIDNIGPFIQSVLTIMQNDDRLDNAFGMNPEYTKEMCIRDSPLSPLDDYA